MPAQRFYEGQEFHNPNDPSAPVLVFRSGKFMPKEQGSNLSGGLKPQEQARIKEAQDSSSSAINVLNDLTRFQDINSPVGGKGGVPTGGVNAFLTPLRAKVFNDPGAQQLEEISARLTPAQRTPGSGTTSDRDLALYMQAVPGINKDKNANNAIIEKSRAGAVLLQQRADFYDKYASEHGTLNGAEQAFRAIIGKGSRQNPYKTEEAGDRSQLPRGAYYMSPEGLRRNDNGPTGNPIVEPGAGGVPGGKPQRPTLDTIFGN
jgi:hypothetical protein